MERIRADVRQVAARQVAVPYTAEGSALRPRSARLVARRQEESQATEIRLSVLLPLPEDA